jgi:hypothetical protein
VVSKTRIRQVAIPVLLAALLAGAQSARAGAIVLPLPAEDQQTIIAKLGPGVVGEPLPSVPIDDVSTYLPLQERSAVYQVITGRRAGGTETLGMAKVTRPSGKLGWRFEFSPSLAGFIRQNGEGDLEMPSVSDLREGVVVITKPALPFMVKGMKPGESRSFTHQVRVDALDDDALDWHYSGVLHGTNTYMGTYRVTVPAGTYNAVLMRIKCDGKVGPANTHDVAYYVFAPGEGLVAMISQENATAFWIIHIDSSAGRVMRSRVERVAAGSDQAAPQALK